MADENDDFGGTGDSSGSKGIEVPTAVNDAFDAVFSNLSDQDKLEIKEAGGEVEQTETPVQSADQVARGVNARNKILKEQADELNEEGIVSENDPDGTGVKPEVKAEGDETLTPAEKAEVVADAEVKDEVDPSLRLAANEMGWSDEKIDRFFKADPELANETFGQMADTYTNLSRQLLSLDGSQLNPGTQQAEKPAQQQAPTNKLDTFYAGIEAFAEANGEDMANFAKALKSELIDPVREILASNQAKQQELHATEARQTVTALADKFSQFYGNAEGKALTAVETNNRAYLAQVADQLRAGAKAQGREMSIKDALNRAHLVATANHRDQIVRKQISGQVQTRTRQITAKPTQRRDPKLSVGRSTASAIEATTRKMAELGIEDNE